MVWERNKGFFKSKKSLLKPLVVISFIFPALDVISTAIHLISTNDFTLELNPIGRLLLINLGVYAFPLMYIISVSCLIGIWCLFLFFTPQFYFNYVKGRYKKNKIPKDIDVYTKWMRNVWFGTIVFSYLLVFINNFFGPFVPSPY